MDHSKNKMLIDSTHPEETRVVVLRNGRVEEFDWESAARKLLRGNIYLAKVTRVEPSLQAAFVDYGGNRHGFLAFSEIHPDYYQIPVADRQALLQEEAEAEEAKAKAEAAADAALPEVEDEPADEEEGERERDREGEREPRRRRGRGRWRDREERDRERAVRGEQAEADAPLPEVAAGGEPQVQPYDVALRADEPVLREALPPEVLPQASSDTSAPAPLVAAADAIPRESATGLQPEPAAPSWPTAGRDPVPEEPLPPAADEPVEARSLPRGAESERVEGNGSDKYAAADLSDAPEAHGLIEEQGVIEVVEPEGNGASEVETVGSEDAVEELPDRPRRPSRTYKIQEVIKRRQIILVQVVKEERGNKGAALTTYLSLAGRYTVLMPNTARGGGISRKITNPADRKRLRKIVAELEVPKGMGLIVRTAGASRTKAEIKRDFEYLLRLWESVRDLTLRSQAPALVYEEGDLIKRSIRDLYNKDIDEIVVAGEPAWTDAHDFMKMLMPSHAENVIRYREPEPLFTRYQIERQLNAMFSPFVTLKSGGYIVINQTEALVSIDVNSGKATREHNIEDTALKTNIEAAEEIARQLKLRDLAGLIVIDFIDMEEKRNNRSVERKLKECLRHDRARIQVGRISHFGLLEMSRQRLRPGVLEGSTSQCPHCQGTGIIRSTESVALGVLRALEDKLMSGDRHNLVAETTADVALYILNQKRHFLNDMEARYGVTITITASDKVQGAAFVIERGPQLETRAPASRPEVVQMDWAHRGEDEEEPVAALEADEAAEREEETEGDEESLAAEARESDGEGEADGERRRGRRRRRRRARGEQPEAGRAAPGEPHETAYAPEGNGADRHAEVRGPVEQPTIEGGMAADDSEDDGEAEAREEDRPEAGAERGEEGRRGRRRGRRGGRRGRERRPEQEAATSLPGGQSEWIPEPLQEQPPPIARADWLPAEPTMAELAAAERGEAPGQLQPLYVAPTAPAEAPAFEAGRFERREEAWREPEQAVATQRGLAGGRDDQPWLEPARREPEREPEPAASHEARFVPPPEPAPAERHEPRFERGPAEQEPASGPEPAVAQRAEPEPEPIPAPPPPVEDNRPRRSGWWQKRFS